MANHKTITLNEVCIGILKDWQRDPDFNFSAWVRAGMMAEYNDNMITLKDKNFVPHNQRGQPASQYKCPNCKVEGHHWERNCPFPSKEEQLQKLRMRADDMHKADMEEE